MGKPQALRPDDDSDVLASTCDWWRHKHVQQESKKGVLPFGDGALDEMRFQQLQEVDKIKRVLARRSCHVDVALLDRALVIPEHRLKADLDLFNTMPSVIANPFFVGKTLRKKRGKSPFRRSKSQTGKSKKEKGRSKSAGSPGRKAKPKRKKGS